MADSAEHPHPLLDRFVEVLDPGIPAAYGGIEQLGERDFKLFDTPSGPCFARLFADQDRLEIRLPTRSMAGLTLGIAAARRARMRLQTSFDAKQWIIDIGPQDSYTYLKNVAEILWKQFA